MGLVLSWRGLVDAGLVDEAGDESEAVWATSCQPASMVREWPRPGISTYSVTEILFLRCCFAVASAIAVGAW